MIKNTGIRITAVLLALSGLLASCKKEGKDGPGGDSCTNNGHTKYLKVGNKLEYEYAEFSLSEDTSMTLECVGKKGDSYEFHITGGGQWGSAGGGKRFMKECNDWLLINEANEPVSPGNRTYQLVRKNGDTWTASSVSQYTVVQKDVSVNTRAGTFICDKITFHLEGAFNTDTIYYSNDIGTVKYDGFAMEYELKSKNF